MGQMTELLGGVAGPVPRADGASGPVRITRTGAVVTGDAHGKYHEAVSRGNVFSLVLSAWTTTVAAGNIVGAAAAASTQFALWNPAGSQKYLSLLKFGVWPISGTAPVPPVVHSYAVTCPTIATSVVTPIANNNIGMAASNVAKAVASAAGTVLTGGSALLYLRAADLCITAGAAANLAGLRFQEEINGDIVIGPGTMWVPTWMAAGTTFLGGYSITWEEVPI